MNQTETLEVRVGSYRRQPTLEQWRKRDKGAITITYTVQSPGFYMSKSIVNALNGYRAAHFLNGIGQVNLHRIYEDKDKVPKDEEIAPEALNTMQPGDALIVTIEGSGPLQEGLEKGLKEILKNAHKEYLSHDQ